MKQLGLIEFNNQPEGCKHLATYSNYQDLFFSYSKGGKDTVSLYICGSYLVFNLSEKLQVEIPLLSIKWLTESFQKFVTPADKGGLPKDQNWIKGIINGEELFIRYGVHTGGEFREGLTLSNQSRSSYIDVRNEQSQPLSYDLLFKCGLFNLLKQLDNKLETKP